MSDASEPFEFTDAPSMTAEPVSLPELCSFEGCENPVKEWAGRGRKPTKCVDHAGQQRVPKSRRTTEDDVKLINEQKQRKQAATEKTVLTWLGMLQLAFLAAEDRYCAKAIEENGPPIAGALAKLAGEFKLLQQVIDAGDKWTALLLLTWNVLQLSVKLGVHHNVFEYKGMIRAFAPPPPPKVTDNGNAATGFDPVNVG